MEPISAEMKREGYKIGYRCKKCGHTHKVKSSPNDNFEVISELLKQSMML
jgi:tRNA(Ile2) C34 agmatinyltransferase TiaS